MDEKQNIYPLAQRKGYIHFRLPNAFQMSAKLQQAPGRKPSIHTWTHRAPMVPAVRFLILLLTVKR